MRRAGDRKTPSRGEGREPARSVTPEGVAAATRKPSFSLHRPASTSRSLQRFNAIPCKFVCGQVYTVPGLSVSSAVHPRPVTSASIRSYLSYLTSLSLGQHRPGNVSVRCSALVLCLYHDVYTGTPEKTRVHERERERTDACS